VSYPEWGTAKIKCAKRKCDWTGTEKDLARVAKPRSKGTFQNVCPKCGCESYYFVEEKKPKEPS
jgi:hypothetical protein